MSVSRVFSWKSTGSSRPLEKLETQERSRLLLRHGSRVSLDEDENGLFFEHWQFDEDAYTLGVKALLEKRWVKAWPEVFLALLAPAIQVVVGIQVYLFLIAKPSSPQRLGPKLICTGLCLLQLGDEVVEGMHKMAFCMRWVLGFYGKSCYVSVVLGVLLGMLQFLAGNASLFLSVQVVFASDTTLDIFFNYVALAFIADVDNMIMRSRAARAALPGFTSDMRVQCQADDWSASERPPARWEPCLAVLANGVALVFLPFGVGANVTSGRFKDPPVEFHWLSYIPQTLAIAVAMNLCMWLGSRHFGVTRTAWAISCFNLATEVVSLSVRLGVTGAKCDGQCWYVSPLDVTVMQMFTVMFNVSACAAEPNPFWSVNLMPVQALIMYAFEMMTMYGLKHWGCA